MKVKVIRKIRKPWSRLTDKEKRLAIAKDVLKVLDFDRFIPTHKEYYTETNGKVKPKFTCNLKARHTCKACAKGGLILSLMRLSGRNVVGKVKKTEDGRYQREISGKIIMTKLRPIFGDMADQIEQIFEGWSTTHGSGADVDYSTVQKFTTRKDGRWTYGDYGALDTYIEPVMYGPRKIMRGIMGNIVKNGGDLVPEQGPVFYFRKRRKTAKR